MFRHSRFKHVYGKPVKSDACYQDIRITKTSWDSSLCSVNPKFLAVITESAGGGAFLVLPLSRAGRVPRNAPLVAGHKAMILDIQWCPFDDNVIASASEDCTVKVWHIPDGGLPGETNMTDPVAELIGHQRRVGLVQWHPCAENVLLSAGADNKVFLWNVGTCTALVEMDFADMVLSVSFNYNGSQFVCTNKDKKTRVVDARTGNILVEGVCHEGNKPQRCAFIKDKYILTTGFSRMGERQLAVWSANDMNQPLEIVSYDTSNGVLFPHFDCDTGMLFVTAKGDSNVSYYEIIQEPPYLIKLSIFQSNEPLRGFAWMPKRGMDVKVNEIARFYKMHNKGLCEVISFIVPRKAEIFQSDLYPPTTSTEPALTAEEWFKGNNAAPILMSFTDDRKPVTLQSKYSLRLPSKEFGTPSDSPSNPPIFDAPSKRQLLPPRSQPSVTPSASSSNFNKLVNDLRSEARQLRSRILALQLRIEKLERAPSSSKSHSNHSRVPCTPPAHVVRSSDVKASRTIEERALKNAVQNMIQRFDQDPATLKFKPANGVNDDDDAGWSD